MPIMDSYPVFQPIEITDPMPATLEDMRTLVYDWGDVSTDGLMLYGALRDAWLGRYGPDVVGTDGPVLDDPDALAFAIRIGGSFAGAGVLYNVEKVQTGDRCDLTAELLVAGPPQLVAVMTAQAEGVVAYAADPEHPVQRVVIHLRAAP